jgi:phosphoglycerate dehydrogenase-like enzyme
LLSGGRLWSKLYHIRREDARRNPPIDLIIIPGFHHETSPARLLRIREAAPHLTLRYIERGNLAADALRGCEVLYGCPPPEYLYTAERLKWHHLPNAGIEPYGDLSLYANRSVTLTNSSGVYGAVIAEHVLGMALAMLRHFPYYIKQQAGGGWDRHPDMRELSGLTVLICGMGDLGRCIAEKFRVMGCRVLGMRKVIHDIPPGFAEVYTLRRLPEVAGSADIVVNCLPSTHETVGAFDAAVFEKMRPDALFINVGRGSAAVEADLISALENRMIAGAALDVFEPEPLPPDSPLRAMDNVLVTPHCSGASPAVHDRCFALFFDLLNRYAAGKRLYNIVDFFAGY